MSRFTQLISASKQQGLSLLSLYYKFSQKTVAIGLIAAIVEWIKRLDSTRDRNLYP
jgi:hypothetical protein